MLVKILIVIGAIIALVLIVAAFQPATFLVSRSTLISAPPAQLFAEVNDLHRWAAWSPYEKLDPAMKRTFEGPAAGVGAIYGWTGNNSVGSGKMTITDSRPAEQVGLKLEFYAPMAGVSQATFTFQPEGGQTRVTWAMAGTNNYVGKIFCLFMNMDKMVGGQFAEGLASLKANAEGGKK
jgi:uncharacterized protein YndB with AHSA1/START domain